MEGTRDMMHESLIPMLQLKLAPAINTSVVQDIRYLVLAYNCICVENRQES